MRADHAQHRLQLLLDGGRRPQFTQFQQTKTDAQLARGVIQRQAIVIQLSQAWQQLGDTVDETRGIIGFVAPTPQVCQRRQAQPAVAYQSPRSPERTERPGQASPDEGEEHAQRSGQSDVGKQLEIGAVAVLKGDVGDRLHRNHDHCPGVLRSTGEGAEQQQRHGEQDGQAAEIVHVGHQREEVDAGGRGGDQRGDQKRLDERRRIVLTGEETACHRGDEHAAIAVLPTGNEPQHAQAERRQRYRSRGECQ